MKKFTPIWITILWLTCTCDGFAQILPQVTYQDYGFHKQPLKVESIFYDTSLDQPEAVSHTLREFNADGNLITYEHKSLIDHTWSKAKSVYQNKQLVQEKWTSSNRYFNRSYTFHYNKNGQLARKKLRYEDGGFHNTWYEYDGDKLIKTRGKSDDETTEEQFLYAKSNGALYKSIFTQKFPDGNDLKTNTYYLEGKEIANYMEPNAYYNAHIYLNNLEVEFQLINQNNANEKLKKGLQRYEVEAEIPGKVFPPFSLQQFSDQTLQFIHKNRKLVNLLSIKYQEKNQYGDLLISALGDDKSEELLGIELYQITYANGEVSGSVSFDQELFKKMLLQHVETKSHLKQ